MVRDPMKKEQPWGPPDAWQCEYTEGDLRCVLGKTHTVDHLLKPQA